jgi:serine-type D-Ala-D-Ala carboxypeptidase/endopeptidase (penicillin-binding protein 4)
MRKFLLFINCIMLLNLSAQTGLEEYVQQWANDPKFKRAQVGVAIHDVNDRNIISGYNSEKLIIPASSLKLFTTLITLQRLGKEYKYDTKLAYDGIIVDSILKGNIYIIGNGDPTLGSQRFAGKPTFLELVSSISYKIKSSGIKKIEGNIICDESIFNSDPIAPSWQWDDLGSYYAAGTWGINVNENEYNIWYNTAKPVGEIAEILSVTPNVKNLNLLSSVVTAHSNTDDESIIYGAPNTFTKNIKGTLPQQNSAFKIKGSIPNPPLLLAESVVDELMKMGISSLGSHIHKYKQYQDDGLNMIHTYASVPLVDIVRQANHHSINQYCDALLKTLAYKKRSVGSYEGGVEEILSYLRERGIDTEGLYMEDGSGLSARNLVSPSTLSSFLAGYISENGFETTIDVLPEAGSQGTVRRLLRNSEAKGKVWMKSGSMNKVMSYTGVVQGASGRRMTFSIIVNNYTLRPLEIRNHIESLIDYIYKKG